MKKKFEDLIGLTMFAIILVCLGYLTYVGCKIMSKGGPYSFSPGYSICVTVVNDD